jgi:hypothetical protein
MLFPPSAVLPGERILATKNANFVIASADYNLDTFPHDFLLKRIGFEGKEALGGQLHVTSLRLIFKSHRANRIYGQLSIFLPEITALDNTSTMLVKRLEVGTAGSREVFIVWGVPSLIQTIQTAQREFPADREGVWSALKENPDALGDGMHYSQVMDRLAQRSTDLSGDLGGVIQDPFSAATAFHLFQLYRELTRED